MEELKKVNGIEFYLLWKNLSISLLIVIGIIAFCRMLPEFLSPIVTLIGAAMLYTIVFNARYRNDGACVLVPYCIFICLIITTVVTVVVNMLYVWHIVPVPDVFLFLTSPYLPSLSYMPIFFVTMLVIYLRRDNLNVCNQCRKRNGDRTERGRTGAIIAFETQLQLVNLLVVFGLLSVLLWSYYLIFFIEININSRDWYVFVWAVVIIFFLDELYFAFRYYNLYLDLKDNDEIIDSAELQEMTSKTYLRFYVACGNNVYVDPHSFNPGAPYREIIDTPFFTKRSVNGMRIDEIRRVITEMTGVGNGELRFFYGRKVPGSDNRSVLRFFYFLDGQLSDYPGLKTNGEWMDFEKVKQIYSNNPQRIAPLTVSDITRLATIMLANKTYDEAGNRRSKIKSYTPSFNLIDVRKSDIDFQDDKWIDIAMFNSDTPFFRLKLWWKRVSGQRPQQRRRQRMGYRR